MTSTFPDPRRKPMGGPVGESTHSPIRSKAGVHSVRVSTICEITLTCDESDGEYVALKLTVAAPQDDPYEWVSMEVSGALKPTEGVLADSWTSAGSGQQAYMQGGSTNHEFCGYFSKSEELIEVTSCLLALDYPPDMPFIMGHVALDLVSRADEEWLDGDVDEDAGGYDSPGMMRQIQIPIVVGTWSMPDVQFRFSHYQPTVDVGWPTRCGDDSYYSADSTKVIRAGGRYVADW